MSILVDQHSRVICQGITGKAGAFHTAQDAGSTAPRSSAAAPRARAGRRIDLPVFDTCHEAVAATGADVTMIFVPAPFAAEAAMEAADAGIEVIVCITEGIPVLDMLKVKATLRANGARLIGPNCPGIITSGECKIGIMPGFIHPRGKVGIVSRSGTLTYEAVHQTTQLGLGQSTCVGIGGDPIKGLDFIDCLEMFEADPQTEAVILVGEIGGSREEAAAEYIRSAHEEAGRGLHRRTHRAQGQAHGACRRDHRRRRRHG